MKFLKDINGCVPVDGDTVTIYIPSIKDLPDVEIEDVKLHFDNGILGYYPGKNPILKKFERAPYDNIIPLTGSKFKITSSETDGGFKVMDESDGKLSIKKETYGKVKFTIDYKEMNDFGQEIEKCTDLVFSEKVTIDICKIILKSINNKNTSNLK